MLWKLRGECTRSWVLRGSRTVGSSSVRRAGAGCGPGTRLRIRLELHATAEGERGVSASAQSSFRFLLPVVLLSVAHPLASQEAPRLPLRLKETVPVSAQRSGPVRVPVKCDAQGNVYIQGYRPLNPRNAPIVKISSDGQRAAVFAIDAAPGFKRAHVNDFAVDLSGKLYMLTVKSTGELDIVAFDDQGKYDSTITVEQLFYPAQLAVFLSGDFLVSGMKLSEKDRAPTGEAFTAIFDRAGRLVKELILPGDPEPGKAKHPRGARGNS